MSGFDPEVVVKFAQRPGVLVFKGLVLLVFSAMAILVAAFISTGPTSPEAWIVLAFFGIGAAIMTWEGLNSLRRAFRGRVEVMGLAPNGFWHSRSTRGRVLPWTSVTRIRVTGGKAGGPKLRLDQATFNTLFRSSLGRIAYQINWLTTGPDLALHVGGLDARPREVIRLVKLYASAHGGPRLQRTQ